MTPTQAIAELVEGAVMMTACSSFASRHRIKRLYADFQHGRLDSIPEEYMPGWWVQNVGGRNSERRDAIKRLTSEDALNVRVVPWMINREPNGFAEQVAQEREWARL